MNVTVVLPVMDRFIKSVPLIVALGVLSFVLQSEEEEYSNIVSASICGAIVFILSAAAYIFMARQNKPIMAPHKFILVMIAAGLLAFFVLYASLEYFYA
ncbi:hypothetical protein [Flavobacterium sp. NRK1]|uniref:hypothetical protein n=1 Tax=Flavobacterium sp. NRK1 TaxID=2954929 RepID=UPI00209277A8|nr:hypothetical protein [Flavobacterium sp. NRK1]MCO6148166.1 hypothetical protein [Flavobacterium sp. NRK1]